MFLNWKEFLSLFGLGPEPPDFSLRFKADYWDAWYAGTLITAAFLFAVVPFPEECWRCLRRHDQQPPQVDRNVRPLRVPPGSSA